MKKIVVGLLAHVDAGKTTLAEGLLFQAGKLKKPGRVDHRDSFLDHHFLERSRGITIFSKQAGLDYGETEITLLDTPGHVDFSAEMERTLSVLDYAVLVVSGNDGVQAHTETLWRLLRRYHVPTFLFITKMDISLKHKNELLRDVREHLSPNCLDFSEGVDTEEISLLDEELFEHYLENEKVEEKDIMRLIQAEKLFPCFFGSGLKLDGIEKLLFALDKYTIRKETPGSFGAVVYKIGRDEKGQRLTYVKIISGKLKIRTALDYVIPGSKEAVSEKIHQIRLYSGDRFRSCEEVYAGDICALCGLSATSPGMTLGTAAQSHTPLLEPVLNYRLKLPDGSDEGAFLPKIRLLEEEIPELHVVWDDALKEIHMRLMGEVQIEIIKELIKEKYGEDVDIEEGRILYKETIASPVIGIGHFEPLRHYAEVHLLLEPLEEGSGIVYSSQLDEDILDRNWQRLILSQLQSYAPAGVLTGAPVTDLAVTLVAGRAHQAHTEGGDFRQAAIRSFRNGLMKAESILLEPYYDFVLTVPSEQIGRAINDIRLMDGSFEMSEDSGEMSRITGRAPVRKIKNYQTEVLSYSHGKGAIHCTLGGYFPCADQEKIVEEINYDPLRDTDHPSDSVFCAHGGGFSVPWDKVADYAHVSSGVRINDDRAPSLPDPKIFMANLDIDEKEIEAIMEREFGPIKRRRYRQPADDDRKVRQVKKHTVKDYLIVDGYNMIFHWDGLKDLAEDDLGLARQHLIDLLVNYHGFVHGELILVFDGYKIKGNREKHEEIDGIRVVYTKEGETADAYIERLIKEIGPKDNVRIVSSDALIQISAVGSGVLRVSANELKEDIDEIQKKLAELIDRVNKKQDKITNRIIDKF